MAIRMTGLNSGLNTESIVAALMSAQRTKQTKVENKKTKLEWKQEAWSSLNTKLYSFYKDSLSSMRLASNYKTKAASSSNTTKVTATATTKAATGTYSVNVKSLASTQYVTSGKLNKVTVTKDDGSTSEEAATSKTKLKDLKDAGGNSTFTSGTQIQISAGDKNVYLDVNDDTTIQDFVNKCTEAGLNATFDEKQQRFFISSADSGKENTFTIKSGELSADQKTATDALRTVVGYNNMSTDNKAAVDAAMADLQSGKKTVADVLEQFKTFVNDSVESDAKSKASRFYYEKANKASAVDFTGKTEDEIVQTLKDGGITLDLSKYSTQAEKDSAIESARQELVSKKTSELLASDAYQQGIKDAVENGIDASRVQSELGITDPASIDLYTFENAADRKTNADTAVESALNNYSTQMSAGVSTNGSALAALGMTNVDGSKVEEGSAAANGTGMVVIDAKDTEVVYNGATLTSNTTSLSVAGLELNLLGTTDGETVNITVTNDTSGIYDTIKEFLAGYNSILKEMNTYYNADTAKDYNVLSEEEKEAMSESEVEKWETKIKDSLLRRDTTLSSLISSFRNNMMSTYTASNGKKYALSSLGISTSGDYAEGGLLHIRGDEDDSEYADDDNTLKKMLEEDPDIVMEVLTNLTGNLYNDLQKKMSSTTMSSALTFYNDKEMASQLSDYKTEISKWQTKLNDMEDRYYSQFTAMEKALANMQSQQNSLASLLGS